MKVLGSSVTSAPKGSAGVTGAGCAGAGAGALSGAGVWAEAAKEKAASERATLTVKKRRDMWASSSAHARRTRRNCDITMAYHDRGAEKLRTLAETSSETGLPAAIGHISLAHAHVSQPAFHPHERSRQRDRGGRS